MAHKGSLSDGTKPLLHFLLFFERSTWRDSGMTLEPSGPDTCLVVFSFLKINQNRLSFFAGLPWCSSEGICLVVTLLEGAWHYKFSHSHCFVGNCNKKSSTSLVKSSGFPHEQAQGGRLLGLSPLFLKLHMRTLRALPFSPPSYLSLFSFPVPVWDFCWKLLPYCKPWGFLNRLRQTRVSHNNTSGIAKNMCWTVSDIQVALD